MGRATRLALAAGLLLGAMGLIVLWAVAVDGRLGDFDRAVERVQTPGTVRFSALTGADYTVYVDRGDPSLVVTVTGPDGRGVPVRPALGNYRTGRDEVRALATFTAEESGPHAVQVDGGDGRPNAAFAADVNVPQERSVQVLVAIGIWLAALLGAVLLVLPALGGGPEGE